MVNNEKYSKVLSDVSNFFMNSTRIFDKNYKQMEIKEKNWLFFGEKFPDL